MSQEIKKIVPVILSGGSGSRLWPLSRESHPKQFIGVLDVKTPIIQETIRRVQDAERFHPPLVIGNNAHRFLLAEQLKACGIGAPEILIEPCVRNTAPAIATAALYIQQKYGDALMLVLPTDQVIADAPAFHEAVGRAASMAQSGYLVTFGVVPAHAETGYGYIRQGQKLAEQVFAIDAFVEKPDADIAQGFIASGNYCWNSGMFLFSAAKVIDEFEQLQPALLKCCKNALAGSTKDLDFIRLMEEAFCAAPDVSIDYGLMEHTKRGAVVSLDCGWSDTGSWDLLWKLSRRDASNNVSIGECHLIDTKDCYVRSESGPTIATMGVEGLIIIATKDAVLVADKRKAQSIKELVDRLKKNHPELVSSNRRMYRPWGMYENIDIGGRYQVKHITVKPGGKLSLQKHKHRAEHWVVVTGTAQVFCDGNTCMLSEDQSIYIPQGSMHRIENAGGHDLEIIEVQTGNYLGEDDIVRFDDQYGRT